MFFECIEVMKRGHKETEEHYKPKKYKIGRKMNMKSGLETRHLQKHEIET
jgi:hypothetical protein